MLIHRAYKTELDPTPEQVVALGRQMGAVRFVYNWGLARKIEARKKREKMPSAKTLDNELRKLKDSDPEYAWLQDVASFPRQAALANIDIAFRKFFERCQKGGKGKKGFPRFKSRKRGGTIGIRHFSYRIENAFINVSGLKHIKLKEKGYMPLGAYAIESPSGMRLLGMTITERAGRWFVSVQVEQEIDVPQAETRLAIGVDLGIKSLAVVSDGRVFKNPKALGRSARKMRRAQKMLSRRQKGGANRDKARKIVAKLHYRIACIRGDAAHKLSHAITREPSVIVLENLNVSGMVKNHKLAKAVSDVNMSEIRRQIEYKAKWRGCEVVIADRFYPSSKTCSCCGWVDAAQKLSDRTFVCQSCGNVQDRDLNAARNLAKLAASHAESLNACGDRSSVIASAMAKPVDEAGICANGMTARELARLKQREDAL